MVDKSSKTESKYEKRNKEKKEHSSASAKKSIARSSHSHGYLHELEDEIKKKSPKKDKTFEHSKEVL